MIEIVRKASAGASLLAATLTLAACGQMQNLLTGPGYDIDQRKVAAYAANQTQVMTAISEMAGLHGAEPSGHDQWRTFVVAGIQYSDRQCEAYMNALFWFNRAKSRTTQQITLAGAATIAIMGAVSAAAQALTITGIAFGLASASIENVGSGLLYELDPSAVRDLVKKLQIAYEAGLPKEGYNDRAAAFRALQGYVALCLPPSIETQVTNSVKASKVEKQDGNSETGAPPIVQIGPLTLYTYGEDSSSTLLKNYLYKAGTTTIDPDHETLLQAAMKTAGVSGVSSTTFIYSAQYSTQRAKVATALNLK